MIVRNPKKLQLLSWPQHIGRRIDIDAPAIECSNLSSRSAITVASSIIRMICRCGEVEVPINSYIEDYIVRSFKCGRNGFGLARYSLLI